MEQPYWDRLSRSSKAAMRFAWAAARCRAEANGLEASSTLVDSHDLLVGILLAHPDDSDFKALFDHFGLVPGQALPSDYPLLTSETLRRQMSTVPDDQVPPLSTDVEMITEVAIDLGLRSGSEEFVELKALFASLLSGSSPARESIRELLDSLGVSAASLSDDTVRWVEANRKESYREWLTSDVPFSPAPVNVPNYKADQGSRYRPRDDFVDVRSEVDAFAYLLASRGLDPPMAVGLFGDWGSGKTFFMNALRHRINQLTTSQRVVDMPQSEVPFWKHIVQVDFNAWNYVEGELLASLVEEVFSQLRLASDNETSDGEDRLAQRQRHWLQKLETSRLALEKIQAERRASEQQLEAERRRAEQLRGRYETEVAELERLRARRVNELVLETSRDEVIAALEPVTVTLTGSAAGDALDALNEARDELSRGRALLGPLINDPKTLVRLIISLVLTTIVVWGLSMFDVDSVVPIFGGLASAIGLAVPVLRSSTGWLRSRLNRVEGAQRSVADEIRVADEALQTEISEAEARARTTEEALRAVTDREEEIVADLVRINKELNKTPTQLLGEFIGERVGSSDYRKRLGVPALIRRDFDMLSQLIRKQNTSMGQEEAASPDPNIVNRIILYIDDLDRCPEGKVIEVLQAVHLLLAFELFVVVVAVDSRWLADALTRHFPALAANDGVENPASPDDYLEKIFQIPFWVRPLSADDRMHVVRGLLEGHLAAAATGGHGGSGEAEVTIGSQQERILESLDPSTAPPSLEAAALTITRDELSFLDELAPLMGSTPRSVKRFVNLYQLTKVLRSSTENDSSESPPDPPDDQIAAMMLAIGDGLPLLAQGLVQALARPHVGTLKQLVEDVDLPPGDAERDEMVAWLESRPNWQSVPGSRLAECVPLIERFLFRVGGATKAAQDTRGADT